MTSKIQLLDFCVCVCVCLWSFNLMIGAFVVLQDLALGELAHQEHLQEQQV